jgi:hypothetical protein
MVEHARDKNISFITDAAVDYILTVFAIIKISSLHYNGNLVRILMEKLEDLTKNSKNYLRIHEKIKFKLNILVTLDERKVIENYCGRVDRVNKGFLLTCSIAAMMIALKSIVPWIAFSAKEFPIKVS